MERPDYGNEQEKKRKKKYKIIFDPKEFSEKFDNMSDEEIEKHNKKVERKSFLDAIKKKKNDEKKKKSAQ